MSDSTAIQAAPSAPPAPTGVTGAPPAPTSAPPVLAPRPRWNVVKALKAVASLRLTVFLFVLSLLLVFYGTIAQIDSGIWTIVRSYFRSFWVWIPLQLNVQFGQVFLGLPRTLKVPGAIPFPGGWTLGALLLVNLLAAHAVRFKISWKRSGIFLIHIGLIVLMLGELVTGLAAVEGRMSIFNGRTSNYVEDYHDFELAFSLRNPDGKSDDVIVVPSSKLAKGGTIEHDILPCAIEVHQYMTNSALKPVPPYLKGANLPVGWRPAPDKGKVWAAFQVGEGKQSAEFTINTMQRNFGDLLANVNRWRAQVGAEPIEEDNFEEADIPLFKVDGQTGQYFDYAGPEKRLLLIAAPYGEAMWFYKLMGPRDVVAQYKATFERIVGALRYFDPENQATHGAGRLETAVEQPEVSGAAAEQAVDVASVYVTFKDKNTGKEIGTYLMSAFLTDPQEVRIGGKVYQVALRFKRTYKPYTIHLKQFTHEVYPGTTKPKNFASLVEVTDDLTGKKQEVLISMNNPLHYAGETFYQASFMPRDQGTILQVVHNPGWLMPYLSCGLVGVGMLIHFNLGLVGFFAPEGCVMNHFNRFFPWFVAGVGALYLLMMVSSPAATYKGMNLDEAGEIAVQDGGRVKPLDTYARTTLMILSGRQTFKDENDKTQPAVKWFLDLATRNPRSDDYKVFRITNEQVLYLMGLEPRSGFRYAFNEFKDKVPDLKDKADRVAKVPPKERDLYAVRAMELAEHLEAYFNIKNGWVDILRVMPSRDGGDKWLTFRAAHELIGQEDQYQRERASQIANAEKALEKVANEEERARLEIALDTKKAELAAERKATKLAQDQFLHLGTALQHYASVSAATGDASSTKASADAFNSEVGQFRDSVNAQAGNSTRKVGFEAGFNSFAPFYQCSMFYIFVFVLGCVAWLNWGEPLNRAAFLLAVLTLVVHTFALIARMYIGGRPPVTNLYSSAVFIGWGCVGLCLVLEVIFKNGIGNVVAAVLGSLTMLIAHHLAAAGDTLEMMQAVLDTNFWLATHVTCITMGYTATFVAGFLGILYILGGVFTTALTKERSKTLGQMIYGVVCFATLLSFVGTVLGGIWADYSWGRFWGWDPKENGALLIVIINALVLHARWGAMVRERGMAVLVLCGNMVTMWSWFGTNQLGVGLHAYGFNNTLATACTVVWGTHLGLIGLGVMPLKWWRSFKENAAAATTPKAAAPPPPAAPRPAPKQARAKGKRGHTWAKTR